MKVDELSAGWTGAGARANARSLSRSTIGSLAFARWELRVREARETGSVQASAWNEEGLRRQEVPQEKSIGERNGRLRHAKGCPGHVIRLTGVAGFFPTNSRPCRN